MFIMRIHTVINVIERSLTFCPLFRGDYPLIILESHEVQKINHWDRGCFTAIFNVYKDIKALFVCSIGLHICSYDI